MLETPRVISFHLPFLAAQHHASDWPPWLGQSSPGLPLHTFWNSPVPIAVLASHHGIRGVTVGDDFFFRIEVQNMAGASRNVGQMHNGRRQPSGIH